MYAIVLFQLRGQDFIIDLCGAIDIFKPIILVMIRSQAVDLPPWKTAVWFERLISILTSMENKLENIAIEDFVFGSNFPNLSEHWGDITCYEQDDDEEEKEGTFKQMDLLLGGTIVEEKEISPEGNEPGNYQFSTCVLTVLTIHSSNFQTVGKKAKPFIWRRKPLKNFNLHTEVTFFKL